MEVGKRERERIWRLERVTPDFNVFLVLEPFGDVSLQGWYHIEESFFANIFLSNLVYGETYFCEFGDIFMFFGR